MSGSPTTDLPDGSWPWLHDFARWLGMVMFRVPFRLRVHGRDRIPLTGPMVVVVNHSSYLDGPIVFGALGRRSVFLIKQEIYIGPFGWLLRKLGHLALHRRMADRGPLLAAVDVLRAGGVVGIFPEGARGSGDVITAQNGAAWLARYVDAVILPIACRGTRRRAGQGRPRRRVDVLVGEPITPLKRRGKAGLAEDTERVRASLAKLVATLDSLRTGSALERDAGGVEKISE